MVTWDGAIHGGKPSGYGCDIGFTFVLYQLGLVFKVIEADVKHLRIVERGEGGVNKGCHLVQALKEPEEDLHGTTTFGKRWRD